MNGGIRPALVVGLWIGLGVALPISHGCSPSSQMPPQREARDGGPEQSFRNLELRETSQGRLEWILRARHATRPASLEPTHLESLRVEFYQGGPRVRSVLTADSGRVDTKNGTLLATGNVVVVTVEGSRLETEQLSWDRKNAKVISETFVRLTRGPDVLTGIGFQSDPNLESYTILKEVRASVREGGSLGDEIFSPDSSRRAR